jgi:spore germination cell wall hydrolase CwlJ-like protein
VGTRRIRRDSGLRWLSAALTPWATGIGLLVSFTATAGTELSLGATLIPARDARIAPPLPTGTILIGSPLRDGYARADAPLRGDLKLSAHLYPMVQRDGKGDAALPPGPSFAHSALALRDAGSLLMTASLTGSVTGLLTPGIATWNPDLEPEPAFVPTPDLGLGVESLGTEASGIDSGDGSTPAIPRAIALSSTTPAPADAIPIEVAAANLVIPGFSTRRDPAEGVATLAPEATPENARHRYADLIVPDAMDREQRCLAEAVYFEARSEPEDGQAAVAQVVLNRVKSGLYPGNVCGVVYQNRHRYMGCQFSFACEGKSLHITDGPSWQSATRIASAVIEGRTYLSEVGGATHYHADYVRPGWSRRLQKMDVIGRHIFYQLKRGQT